MYILDSFNTVGEAERFTGEVLVELGRKARVYYTAAAAQAVDPIPVDLVAPVVHVERGWHVGEIDDDLIDRDGNLTDEAEAEQRLEARLEAIAQPFGGRYVGT